MRDFGMGTHEGRQRGDDAFAPVMFAVPPPVNRIGPGEDLGGRSGPSHPTE